MKKRKKKSQKLEPAKVLTRFDIHRIWLESHLHNLKVLELVLPEVENLVKNFERSHPKLRVKIDTGQGAECFSTLEITFNNQPVGKKSQFSSVFGFETGIVSKRNRQRIDSFGLSITKAYDIPFQTAVGIRMPRDQIIILRFDLSKANRVICEFLNSR